MQSYLANQPVNVTIPLIDSSGVAISALSVSYRLIDQNETELIPKTSFGAFAEGDTSVTIAISDLLNAIEVGDTKALRVIELYPVTEVGSMKIEYGYFIEAEEVLVEGVNSFQNYNKAIFSSYEIPNIEGWGAASKQDRIAALISARRSIGHLRFRYALDAYQNIVDNTVGFSDLSLATPEQWLSMPKEFREAVCRAQILEADSMLGGDEIGDIRRAGLMSKTVGEAKQFFRTTKAIESIVCKRAMKELSKYVLTAIRLSRV